jgi:hypothetical protein
MYNLNTGRVINSRDVIWLNMLYKEHKTPKVKKEIMPPEDDELEESSDEEVNTKNENFKEKNNRQVINPTSNNSKEYKDNNKPKVNHALRKLEIDMNYLAKDNMETNINVEPTTKYTVTTVLDEINSLERNYIEFGLSSAVESGYKEPKTYKQAMNRPEPEKSKWMEAIQKEFDDMNKTKLWEIVDVSNIEKGRRLI